MGVNWRKKSFQMRDQDSLHCQGLVYRLTLPVHTEICIWRGKAQTVTTTFFLESISIAGRFIFPFFFSFCVFHALELANQMQPILVFPLLCFFPPGNWCEATSHILYVWSSWPQPGRVHACSLHTEQGDRQSWTIQERPGEKNSIMYWKKAIFEAGKDSRAH